MGKWREDIADRFDLPAETSGSVRLTITGRRRALVENHRGLLEYTPELVEVAGSGSRVRILGDGLTLSGMDRDAVLITGNIVSVELI